MTGAGLTALVANRVGTDNLLLCSALVLALCAVLVALIVRREKAAGQGGVVPAEEEGVGGKEALRLLRESRHLQIIALVIAFAAIGAGLIEQQLNMAAEAFKGRAATDNLTAFLAQVTLYLSFIGFLIQVGLTSRVHRRLGVGFALMVLPTCLGATGLVMLLNAALWAPALARILDTSLRYSFDKTTREILFLPLPTALKYKAKPFVDVTVDRFAKGLAALLALVLIKPWGLGLNWQQISWASLVVVGLWVFTALRARREYMAAFRRSIEKRELEVQAVRPALADVSTVEALVEELAHPDEPRVLYAIDLLESLDKRHLVTPLLLHHESEKVRVRALLALEAARPEIRERWRDAVERLLADGSVEVRAAAVQALAAIRGERAAELMRAHLQDRDPRLATIAAVTLAGSARAEDVAAAEDTLKRLAADTRDAAVEGRRQVAAALGQIPDARFRPLLVPLMFDPALDVAREAVRSAGRPGASQELLLPPLVSLLRHRPLRAAARSVLVGRGEDVLDVLAYFLRDGTEDIEVRRQIPATLGRIPSRKSMELLVACLGEADEPLRDQALAALERLRRERPVLAFAREPVEERALAEARRYFRCFSLRHNLLRDDGQGSLLDRALEERLLRSVDRVYRLLGILYPWRDVVAARRGMEGDARARARAAEYLDNLLRGPLRQWLIPLLEDIPPEDRARRANALLKTRARDVEDTLAQLIHDEDQVVSATAIHRVEEKALWRLADDLEHVLAHRDARDWVAFEAASWALAARRITAEGRRARWREPLPAVEAAHRLREVPLLRFASVDALVRIAGASRTTRPEAGHVLVHEGIAAGEVQLLVDGSVITRRGQMPPRELAAPAALGLGGVLGGERALETVRAGGDALCLALGAPELLALLSEDVALTQALFRAVLMDGRAGGRAFLRSRGGRGTSRPAGPGARTLEDVGLLEASPLFERATAEQLLHLAEMAREEPLVAGSTLLGEADPCALYVLDRGEVIVEGARGEPTLAAAGDTLGVLDSLGGVRGGRVRVTAPGSALRIDGEALLELLSSDPGLLQGLFGALQESAGSQEAAVHP
jgi:HEAT repeat protein